MTPFIRNSTSRLLGPLARAVTSGRVRILMYHRFGPDGAHRRLGTSALDLQLRYLKAHFQPTPLAEVVARLRSGRALAPRAVVITVDDGYADFATHAYPLLQRYRVPATVYVVSRFVSGACWLWFDAIQWLADSAAPGDHELRLDGASLSVALSEPPDRFALWSTVADLCLARAPEAQWRIVGELAEQLECRLPSRPTPEFAGMRWEDIRRLDPSLVEIGAHTLSHPILSRCAPDAQREEVGGCKSEIERELGREVTAFCYPNGMPEDFTRETESIVEESGFTSAVMACGGFSGADSTPYRLERLGAPLDLPLFRNAVNGIWHLRGQ